MLDSIRKFKYKDLTCAKLTNFNYICKFTALSKKLENVTLNSELSHSFQKYQLRNDKKIMFRQFASKNSVTKLISRIWPLICYINIARHSLPNNNHQWIANNSAEYLKIRWIDLKADCSKTSGDSAA